jgi:hypothetical protein
VQKKKEKRRKMKDKWKLKMQNKRKVTAKMGSDQLTLTNPILKRGQG